MNDDYDPIKNPLKKGQVEEMNVRQLEDKKKEIEKAIPKPHQLDAYVLRPRTGQLGAMAQAEQTRQQHVRYAVATKDYKAVNKELAQKLQRESKHIRQHRHEFNEKAVSDKNNREEISSQHRREFNQKINHEHKEAKKNIEERIKKMQEKQQEKARER